MLNTNTYYILDEQGLLLLFFFFYSVLSFVLFQGLIQTGTQTCQYPVISGFTNSHLAKRG